MFDYIIIIWYSHLHVLIPELIQSDIQHWIFLVVNSPNSEKIRADHTWNSTNQHLLSVGLQSGSFDVRFKGYTPFDITFTCCGRS